MRFATPLVLLLGAAGSAHAEDLAPSPIAPPAAVDLPGLEIGPPAPTPPDRRSDAAWVLYHRAFIALEDHDREGARLLIAQLVREHPGHPATVAARRVAEILKVSPDGELVRVSAELTDAPSPTARAELATVQTIHGGVLGVELCVIAGCKSSDAAPLGLALIGASVGALITLTGFDAVRPSTRSLVDGGTVFGFGEGLFAALAVDSADPAIELVAGQLAGLGLGLALTQVHPTSGQVALASSAGMWTTFVGLLAYAAITPDASTSDLGLVGLVTLNVGIAGGAALTASHPNILRAQTLVIDAGALVGGIAGGAIGTVVTNDASAPLVFGTASLGATIGLVTALLLTPEISGSSQPAPVQSFVIPPEHGHGAIVGVGFRW